MPTAAIYARYSSESQRKESIADQVAACQRFAEANGIAVIADAIYTDEAMSGSRHDRPGLTALTEAAKQQRFDTVLVDDLSRLARDNLLMLSTIAAFQYEGCGSSRWPTDSTATMRMQSWASRFAASSMNCTCAI